MAKTKTVEIKASVKESYLIDLKARDFHLVIDQPPPTGADAGPSPLEYLFFALAGCICTVGKIVAYQKKIDLKGMEVRIEGFFDPEVLIGKEKNQRAGFQSIRIHTKIDAPLSPEEKKAFLREVESRCPVSENLANPTPIELIVEE